jgi:hypothetical protein
MKIIAGLVMLVVLSASVALVGISHARQLTADIDICSGYYSREGNDGGPAATTGHSIYIKFYPDQRVALLYVPFPYSKTVGAAVLHDVFKNIGERITTKSYVRGKFDLLTEDAVAHMETYETKGSRAVFECDGNAPCVVDFSTDAMMMSKSGIIGQHMIKFDHVDESP